jgi:hypothetical protein
MSARVTWLVLILAALALRLPDIGNPLVDLDEQMYLLVGQRMWDGAIPYVDIWDRKPIGLFLLYAATQALPADGIVAYHLVALAAAIGTAGLIARQVRAMGHPAGALPAGLLYLVWLELAGGRGGQSPVFYNALVAFAAVLAWRGRDGDRRVAVAAMLAIGVGLQIKPTVVFEGAAFGLMALAAAWRRGARGLRLGADALLYASAAMLPTALAFAVYAVMGQGAAWWFANVESIFLRHTTARDPILDHLTGSAIVLAVPTVVALRGLWRADGDGRQFLAVWLVAAAIGWLLVPPYFNHYALPLLVPIAVAAGVASGTGPTRLLVFATGAGLLLLSGYPHPGETRHDRRALATLAAAVNRARGGGCPFVFQAPPALYTATQACLPTRYPFPPHLIQASEYGAIGVDPEREVARILAAAPPVIVTGHTPVDDNGRTVALVARALAIRYRAVVSGLGVTVYARKGRCDAADCD